MGGLSLVAPGDRASLHATARGLRDLADAFRQAHATQHHHGRLPDRDLGGDTGASFRRGAATGAAEFRRYHRVARAGAHAFDQLAWDMRRLQHLYDEARSCALEGVGLVSADGTRLIPPPATTPGMPRPDLSSVGLTWEDNLRAWDKAVAAYHVAEDYRVQAQKAFLDALNRTTFYADHPFDTSGMTPPWHTDTPYEPAPPPHHHHDEQRHHGTHRDSETPTTTIPAHATTPTGGHHTSSHQVGTTEEARQAQQAARQQAADHETGRDGPVLEVAHRDGATVDSVRHAHLHTWIESTTTEVHQLHQRIGVLEGLARPDGHGHTVLPSRIEQEISRLHERIATDEAKIAAWRHELHPDQLALAVAFDTAPGTPIPTVATSLPAAS